ncbi:unnamed protein product [Pylaiella littoralis]
MAAMLRVGERVLLLALSEEPDKHPLGYLSSRLLADAEGRSSFATMDCSLTSFRDAPQAETSWEPVVVSDCIFRVEACVDRHDANRHSLYQRHLEPGSSIHTGMQPGTPVRYSKAVQLVHEFSGALLCVDVQERAESEGFAMKVVLKTVEPPSGDAVSTDEWSDTWWEIKSPGNVRISQVLHYDEVCLHSNRWERSVRAHPTILEREKRAAAAATAAGTATTTKIAATPVGAGNGPLLMSTREKISGQVQASFSHSLLRVVPYDDCPSLPYSDGGVSVATAATPGVWPVPLLPSLSWSSSYALAANGGVAADSAATPFVGFDSGGVAVNPGAIRGGDVVRLCHLTSTGFLTCEAIASEKLRQGMRGPGAGAVGRASQGGAWGRGGGQGGERGGGEGESEGPTAAIIEARGQNGTGRSGGDSGPFLYVSASPHRRQKLQNASSNCLWVLERTHCALGGRPLRGSCSSAAAPPKPRQQGGNSAALPSTPLLKGKSGGNGSGNAHQNQQEAPSPRFPPYSGYSSGGGGSGGGSTEQGRRRQGDAGVSASNEGGGRGSSGASNAHSSSFFASSGGRGGRDTYAEAVAKRRRRQGAGDAVEHVRIKHLATMRYLCVGKKCDPVGVVGGSRTNSMSGAAAAAVATAAAADGAVGPRRRGDSRKEGSAAETAAKTRVGMLTVEPHSAIPAATVFVIRPRTPAAATAFGSEAAAMGPASSVGGPAADRWLGPDDLVHLQHKDTGLFLSALPLDREVAGGNVGLTMVKSPLTTEARTRFYFYWRITRAPERERKATNQILTALEQLKATLRLLVEGVEIMPIPGAAAAGARVGDISNSNSNNDDGGDDGAVAAAAAAAAAAAPSGRPPSPWDTSTRCSRAGPCGGGVEQEERENHLHCRHRRRRRKFFRRPRLHTARRQH